MNDGKIYIWTKGRTAEQADAVALNLAPNAMAMYNLDHGTDYALRGLVYGMDPDAAGALADRARIYTLWVGNTGKELEVMHVVHDAGVWREVWG